MKRIFFIAAVFFFSVELFLAEEIDLGRIVTEVNSPEKVEKIITSEEIKKSAARDLPQLLREKGFLVMSSGGSGTDSNFSFKGYAGFCCKVYVDGVLATQPGSGEFDWNSIDINSIESISVSEIPEFFTDQFAGCAVYITTRLVSEEGFDFKTLVTSYEKSLGDTMSVFGEYRNFYGNTGIKVNFQADKADNLYLKKNNKPLENNWSNNLNLNGTFNTLVCDNFTVSGTSKFFYNHLKAFGTGSSMTSGIESDFNSFQTVKLRYLTEKSGIIQGNLTSQFNQIDYDQSAKIHDRTQIHSGDFLLTGENFYGFNVSSLFSLESKISGARKNRFHNTTKINYGYDFNHWLKISPEMGIMVSSNGDLKYLPKLTFSSIKTGFAVSGFRQFVLPTFNQLYWDGSGGKGNPDLFPESGWAVVSSWKSPLSFLPVSLTYTWARYGNKIRWGTVDGVLTPENSGNAVYKTFEARLEKSFSLLSIYGGITYTRATLDSGKQIMWVPEWQWNGGLSVKVGSVEAAASFIYTGRRPEDNWNYYWLDPVNNLTAFLNWHVSSAVTVIISADNLLDERLVYHDNYPAPSRSVTAGFMIRK